jgi:flagellar assembly protein FliH
MKPPVKHPEKLRAIPRAQMLRQGSYRLSSDPAQAVVIKSARTLHKKPVEMNETDWFYSVLDAVWEKSEQAYYQGLDEGFGIGLRRGQAQSGEAAANFRRVLETLELNLLEFYSGVEHWSVKLAVNLAEKVIGNAADQHQDLIKETVRRTIKESADKSQILVRVHPSDYEVLRSVRTEITALSEGIEHFKIEADGGITPGSCRVETPSGLLDADFSTQMRELRRALDVPEEITS